MGLVGDEEAEDHRLLGIYSSEMELNLSEGGIVPSSVGSVSVAVRGPGVKGSWDSSYSMWEDSAMIPGMRLAGIALIRAAKTDA